MPTRLLFVCGRNRWRSPTAEQIFAAPGIETDSAGVSPDAECVVSAEQIAWADIVFVFEASHRRKLQRRLAHELRDKRVVCLNIPDKYEYMNPELIRLLWQRVRASVPGISAQEDPS